MSIGGCNEKEVKASIKILKKYLVNNFAVLNCLSSYPAPLSEFSFGRTVRFKDEFKVTTGLSDHSNNSDAALITLALGGIIFEKHIILDNKDSAKALDKDFSASKKEFKAYVKSINDGFFSLKQNQFKPMKSETSNVILKRSIYSTKDIAIGEVFTKDNTRSIRPSDGLHPHKYKKLLGVKSKRNIEENTPIKETDLL
jgi:sialic acid synthase SpsE